MINGNGFPYTDTQLSILFKLYRTEEPLTRYRLAKELDISKQTISNNIRKFINIGIIEETTNGVKLIDVFYNKDIKKLFDAIWLSLKPVLDMECQISPDTNDISTVLKNCFSIIILLSQNTFD